MGRALHALTALVCVSSARAAWAECRPAAIPSGEPNLVRLLSTRLSESGIAITPTTGCPTASVRVEQRGDQIHLEVTDTFGRSGTREVRDVATAAAIVASWTSQEIEEGSLPALPEPVAIADSTPASPMTPWPHGLAATFESSAASDRTLWLGGAITGCVRIGPVCGGGLVRAAKDSNATSTSMFADSHELSALAIAELPLRAGAFRIRPGVGLGYVRTSLIEHHLDMHMMPFDMSYASHGLRADVHVSVTRHLGRHISLYADLRGDSAIVRTAIPSGPTSFLRLSLGLQLGAE